MKKHFDGEGYHKLYTKGGKIERQGFFKNYKLIEGKKYYYTADGQLDRIAVYKEGKIFEIKYSD